MDPHLQDEVYTLSVLGNVYEGLTAFDQDMHLEPSLAVRWENPDDLTWRFHLRSGVRFHDGRPLTAADVAFSLNRARTHPGSRTGHYLLAVRETRVIDDSTLEVTTDRPYPLLLNKLRFALIVPRESPPEIRYPIGTGPYRFVRNLGSEGLELEAFRGHWRGPAPEPRVRILYGGDAAQRVTMLLHGDADFLANLPIEDISPVEAEACCRVASRAGLAVAYLGLRTIGRPLSDWRVRRAIDLALDREALVRRLLGGHGRPVGQLVSPQVFGYTPDLEPRSRDLEGARRLLAEAGYAHGFDLVLETPTGRADPARVIAAQLTEAGIRTTVVARPWDELNARRAKGLVRSLYGGLSCVSGDASDIFDGYLHSPDTARGYGGGNFIGYANRALDSLIEQSGQTPEMAQRRAILQQAMRVVMADLPMVPLWVANRVDAMRSEIDWQPRLDGMVFAYEMRRRGGGSARHHRQR